MSNKPSALEVCPVCSETWKGATSYHPDPKINGPHKQCPNGHWTHSAKLYQHRKNLASQLPPSTKPDTLRRMRTGFGVGNENEALRLALAALLAGYEQTLNTLPAGSVARNLVSGAFGKAPQLARGLLG